MALRNFSNSAVETQLAVTVTDSSPVLQMTSVTGWPAAPFTIIVDADEITEEVCLVTGLSGTTATVTRGFNGTSAVAHTAGAVVKHAAIALDFIEANTHVNAADSVHGVLGDVVGTTDSQTLTNKTIDYSANTILNLPPGPTGATGATGATGEPGILLSATPPVDTDVLWADTSSSGVGHAATHGAAGVDPVTLDQSQVTGLTSALAGKVDIATVTTYLEEYLDILDSGEASIPRYNIAVAAGPATSGRVYLTYRRAARTETIDTLAISTGTTAAGATPTLCKIGVYEEDPTTKDLTLVASTANDTTLFASTSTRYERATTANWTKTAGKRYAYAVVVVTTAAMPTFQGVADSNSAGAQTAMLQSPRLAGARIGQTDLPSTIAASDIGVSSSRIFIQAMT